MLQNRFRPISFKSRNLKSIYFFINNILFYTIVSKTIQTVYAKNSYRVDHHINVLEEAQWETVPITLKGKSKFDSIYTNVKSIYNKSIVNPFNKYLSSNHHEYETADSKTEENVNNEEDRIEEYQPRLKGEEAFQIDFNCNVENNLEICKNAEKAFQKASK